MESEHRAKYAKLVTPGLKVAVSRMFGTTRLVECDWHFNDIPLAKWDSLAWIIPFGMLCERVCTLKEAARQVVEDYENGLN